MYKVTLLFTTAFILSGCMTTSDITPLGNGTFGVTSLACPACGGTSKSANLALEKAYEYCAEQGKEAVTHDLENAHVNAVGAGGSNLTFSCATPVSNDDLTECASKYEKIVVDGFGANMATVMLYKLFPDSDGFGFKELADATYPTDTEREIIKAIGPGYDECQSLRLSTATPSDKRVLQAAINRIMALMAELSAAQITYGNYAKQTNSIYANLDISLSQREKEARQQRRAQNADRLQAMENLSRGINDAMGTTCTSSSIGDVTTTRCN